MRLAEFRTLTWFPSLARAAFAVVLREEFTKTEDEIARFIGLSRNTVRNILRAAPELALRKLGETEGEWGKRDLKVHMAGGVARGLQGGEGGKGVLGPDVLCERAGREDDGDSRYPLAYTVLRHTKGVKYPVGSPEELKTALEGIRVKGIPIEDLMPRLRYPINNPAELLHELKVTAEGLQRA
ncbi:MAG: bacterio-opsin activator [Deltaproteobacteria bacterium]|nr:MAG: bacterio-opsin activator [Deltaproteobacteria bacterium]